MKKPTKKTTIFKQLVYNVIAPVMLALLILAVVNYQHTKRILLNSYTSKNLIISDEITNILYFQDLSLELIETNLNNRMKNYSHILANRYFKNTKKIIAADLEQIRKELNMVEDIYIIDTTGTIVNTTFKKDLGFNLFNIDEDHKKFLLGILHGKEFVSEKFSVEHNTKRLKKYTYQPTLNEKFIIELGTYSQKADEVISFFKERLNKISEKKQVNIVSVDLFIGSDNPVSYNKGATIEKSHMPLFQRVFDDELSHDTIVKEKGTKMHYQYLYMKRAHTSLYKGSVIRIISDRSGEIELLRKELLIFLIVFGITISALFALIFNKVKLITRPIQKLGQNVKRIIAGNLNERAQVTGNNEVSTLSEHFNLMIEQLESFYKDLEEKVEERTAEVVKKSEQLELVNKELEKLSIVASETESAITIMDKAGNFEWINEGFTRMYNLTLEQLKTELGESVIDASTNPNVINEIKKCIAHKKPVTYESFFITRDGNEIWSQTTLTPILDKQNNVTRLVSIDSDISKIKAANEEIKNQSKLIEEKNQQITQSINYAKKIQVAVLKSEQELQQLFPESFILFRPRDIVSGDFYWFTQIDTKTIIAAIDCTGHGVPGAIMSVIGNTLMNEIVNVKKITYPSQILEELHKGIVTILQQQKDTNSLQDGMDLSLCTIDQESNLIQYAGARNPLYILNNDTLEIIKATRRSIGGTNFRKTKPEKFVTHDITINKEMSIYMFSDGYIDQFGGLKNRKLGSKRFKQILSNNYNKNMEGQKAGLTNTFLEWKEKKQQTDDVLVIGLKF